MERTSAPDATARDTALERAAAGREQAERQLFELLRIPSVSTQAEHAGDCAAAAEYLAADMRRIGLEHVHVHLVPGGHPLVTADWLHAGAEAPTVLVYGHYDVQPPDPLDEWRTDPFDPTVVDGNVHARGASDDKGQLFVHLKSIEACLADGGTLPVNVRFLLEGEEESGSVHLEPFVREHADLLAADVALVSDTHMPSETQPSLITSLRGMTYTEIHVQGPSHDLHSGTFGGTIRNPAEFLCRLIASVKDADGRILIPGFYDDVLELTDDERAELARSPVDDEHFRREAGVEATFGEAGFTAYERVGARPTLEVNGIVSGYTGEGAKTVLPARAMAKVSMRLVPHQRWERIFELFRSHVESLAEPGVTVRVEPLHGGEPSLVPADSPAMRAAGTALERVWGTRPVLTREGGSIPVIGIFDEILGISTVLMGFGLPDDRLHSPNEKMSLAQFHRGIRASIHFWHELALEAAHDSGQEMGAGHR